MTYAEALKDTATLDIEAAAERISDESKALRAKNSAAREALARSQIHRARKHIQDAKAARKQARDALLLDEEEPDGI